jgi:DNA-binding NarL/FixJ family response regulator
VLKLIADGLTNAGIRDQLVISQATVKTHVNRIFSKIGAHDGPRPSATPSGTVWRTTSDRGNGRFGAFFGDLPVTALCSG